MRRRKVQALINAPKLGDFRVKITARGNGTCTWMLQEFADDWRNPDGRAGGPDWVRAGYTANPPVNSAVEAEKAARKAVKEIRRKRLANGAVGTITVNL